MRVSVVRGGGLAGLVSTTSTDSRSLSPERRDELEAHVERARIFDLPARAGGAVAMPDALSYTITVDEDGRSHTVTRAESELPDEVRALVSWLDALPEREEHVG